MSKGNKKKRKKPAWAVASSIAKEIMRNVGINKVPPRRPHFKMSGKVMQPHELAEYTARNQKYNEEAEVEDVRNVEAGTLLRCTKCKTLWGPKDQILCITTATKISTHCMRCGRNSELVEEGE